jgi:hypothetical protein
MIVHRPSKPPSYCWKDSLRADRTPFNHSLLSTRFYPSNIETVFVKTLKQRDFRRAPAPPHDCPCSDQKQHLRTLESPLQSYTSSRTVNFGHHHHWQNDNAQKAALLDSQTFESSSVTLLQAVLAESGCKAWYEPHSSSFISVRCNCWTPAVSCCQLTVDSSSRSGHHTILYILAATLCSAPGRTGRRGGSSTCAGTAEPTRRKRPGRASTGASSTMPNSERIADAGACATNHALRLLVMRKPASETP